MDPPARLILLFAGHGSSSIFTPRTHTQASFDASEPAGSLLLSACHEALLSELRSLTESQRNIAGLDQTDFPSPKSLLLSSSTPHLLRNPIITGLHLFLIQTLRFLATAEFHANHETNIAILAFSSGLLSASVAASSINAINYLANAVEVFRLTFWIAFRVQEWKRRVWPGEGVWSTVVLGMSKEELNDRLSKFGARNNAGPLGITSLLDNSTVTISGRPDVLSRFSQTLPSHVTLHQTTMNALYHSPLLHDVKEQVLIDVQTRRITWPHLKRGSTLIIGLCEGEEANTLEVVLDMILVQPVDWEKTVVRARSFLDTGPVQLRNYGPGVSLASGTLQLLQQAGKHIKYIDLSFHEATRPPEPTKLAVSTAFCSKQVPIAIVGMAVNMPGAPDINALWNVLEGGINTISEIPETRFKVSEYNSGTHQTRRMKAHTGNFISEHSVFDAAFFRISPREAKSMDPQQRVLLHAAYHALENAGYVPDPASEPQSSGMGVWVGAATTDWVHNLRGEVDLYHSMGTIGAFLSGRISYAMKLNGPSVTVNTACSSSLVAIYQACRALMNGDCNAALAGGVNMITSPDTFLGLDRGHFLSHTGQCKPFDASADGYARSEGCGMFVLKRLSDAIDDNDNILGVIRNVEVNQSCRAHSIVHPHGPTQVALLRALLANAGVTPNQISVVEAHGTGTQAGDTSELESIRKALALSRTGADPLYVTSIKANIGHLEAASGAAGLAKLLLMLQHSCIAPQISLKNLNPRIAPLEQDHTVIATKPTPWRRLCGGSVPRMAVLNNYGASGSNVALLLEEWVPPTRGPDPGAMAFVFGMSAKTSEALEDLRAKYLEWLSDCGDGKALCLPDLAYTMTARRQVYHHRLAVAASSREELVEGLTAAEVKVTSRDGGQSKRVVFVFAGQGAYYLNMGASLYHSSPVFRNRINECDGILLSNGFVGVRGTFDHSARNAYSLSEEIQTCQTSLFALEFALAKLWMSWGAEPVAVIGHSLGEYAALVVAQVLSLSDALMLVAHRARYMAERCPPGSSGMMAVGMNSTSVERTLGSSSAFDELVIACYNGPTDVVVSGPFDQLVAFKDHLHAESLCNCRLLSVPFAFHSPAMQPLLDDLDLAASRVSLRAPHIPICANVLGEVVMPGDESVFTNQYFSRHCVQPVLFERCVQSLRSTLPTIEAWVEIGPHTTSLSMLHKNAVSKDALLLGSLRKGQSAWTTLANSLAQLYCSDIHLSWRAVFSHLKSVRCVETPLYPFARTKFWVDYRDDLRTPTVVAVPQPEAEMPMPIPEYSMLHSCTQIPSSANANEALFETPIDAFISSIDGHKVGGVPLCPASVYLDQALCAIQSAIQYLGNVSQHMHIVLKDIGFAKPLVHNGTDRVMKTSITFSQRISGVFTVTSYVRGNSEEVVHVRGDFRVQATLRTTTKFLMTVPTLNQRITNILETIDGESPQTFASRTIYDVIFSRVVEYAKSYRAIMSLTVDHTSMNGVALVKLPDECDPGRFVVHPAYLDTLLHVAGFIANLQCDPGDVFICSDVGTVKIISGLIDRDQLYKMCCNSAWMPHGRGIVAEVYAMQKDEPHRIVAHMKGIHFRLVRLQNLSRSLKRDQHKLTDMHASDVIQAPSASVSPSLETDDIGAEVIKVVAETCNVSATTLSLNTNVQDLGLDSLMSIELSHKIRCTFPHVLSSSCHLMLCSTIADILQIVTSGPSSRSGASTPHTLVPDSEDGCGKTNAVLGDQVSVVQSKECLESPELSAGLTGANIAGPESGSPNGSRIPQPNDFLHRLQDSPTSSHTERSPLVLIHDGSGLINHYERLPPLYRTVFGIQNPHFITAQPWDSLVKMAAQYAQRISASLPKGGVLLGGWSFGGVVAVETARQLLSTGYSVKGVLLIDSPCPIHHVPLSEAIIDFFLRIDRRDADCTFTQTIQMQIQTNSLLLAQHTAAASAGPYPRMALLHSRESFNPPEIASIPQWLGGRDCVKNPAAGWEALSGASVPVWSIPGNHFQAFDLCNVEEVAYQMIEACRYLDTT